MCLTSQRGSWCQPSLPPLPLYDSEMEPGMPGGRGGGRELTLGMQSVNPASGWSMSWAHHWWHRTQHMCRPLGHYTPLMLLPRTQTTPLCLCTSVFYQAAVKAVVASTRLGSASGHSSHDSSKQSQNESPNPEPEKEQEETVEEKVEAADLIEPQAADPKEAASEGEP